MTRKQEIDKYCKQLATQWKKRPELRFGQFIVDVYPHSVGLFYSEEKEIIKNIKSFYTK